MWVVIKFPACKQFSLPTSLQPVHTCSHTGCSSTEITQCIFDNSVHYVCKGLYYPMPSPELATTITPHLHQSWIKICKFCVIFEHWTVRMCIYSHTIVCVDHELCMYTYVRICAVVCLFRKQCHCQSNPIHSGPTQCQGENVSTVSCGYEYAHLYANTCLKIRTCMYICAQIICVFVCVGKLWRGR